ncbi:MAG: peptide deformylase [Candidatus Latescibacteria bacterium]|nr:peptide deformylase [Candidatus Latescibacterota bacterium]
MALIPIRRYGDPILRKKTTPAEEIDERITVLAEDMIETMYTAEGIGLAAPQVGESIRLIVVDKSPGDELREAIVMVNPEVLETLGEDIREEGCLSIPDIREEVVRPETIISRFQTLSGEWVTVRCRGLLARVILHEVDHLDGVLFIDRISPLRRQFLRGRLRTMAIETRQEMEKHKKAEREKGRKRAGIDPVEGREPTQWVGGRVERKRGKREISSSPVPLPALRT